MAAFQYIAINTDGKRKKNIIEADSARHARAMLREQGYMVLEIQTIQKAAAKTETGGLKSRFRSTHMSSKELCLVTHQMSTLLAAGIPLDEVLASVANQNNKANVRNVLLGVRSKIMEGYPLATGMADFPRAFPKLYCTTIASGEKSGKLDQVLIKLAEYTEKKQQMRRKIQQALIYPMLMLFVSICVIIFMLVYIVPKIIGVFNQTNQVLPLATTILIGLSEGLKHYGIYMLATLSLAFYGFSRALRQLKFRRALHTFLLKIPLIGKSIRTINSARFARTFGILSAASVPILEAIEGAAKLISSIPMREAVMAAIPKIREGANIHTSLDQTGYFSPMFIHLIGSGESSGRLEMMLQKAAHNQETEVEAFIEGSLTLFEPIMILVMGGVVMFIVLAIMLPIFALDNFNG